jgi:hypothetical protein
MTITLLLFLQGALSDEGTGLQLAVQSLTAQVTEDRNHTNLPSATLDGRYMLQLLKGIARKRQSVSKQLTLFFPRGFFLP